MEGRDRPVFGAGASGFADILLTRLVSPLPALAPDARQTTGPGSPEGSSMSPMSDQPLTLAVLAQFHRDVILPDVERVVGALELRMDARFSAVDGHFDAIYHRFDRLETEYQMLVAGLRQVDP
jgi:hypothetical protein